MSCHNSRKLPAGIALILYFEDNIDGLLATNTSFQERIDVDNYAEHLRELIRVCPKTFVLINGRPKLLVDETIPESLDGKL